ncbi:uncharacterized protein BP5553_08406 [Venustampulla echinocandica]|uniref:RRM domain-containing protein n=1 Tax=Venustampulla echinocandica TaxID=2656787 RepID=A0A370TE43_9HELO|nr:uncharacterized protein BP5553_08406 [Venustampulla echinocandica]RDL32967.1 hypothetical protein BP5553_08406 [Venustampulla echinocandica]
MADPTLRWAPTIMGVPPGFDEGYEEAWFSWGGLPGDRVIPALPAEYYLEQQEGRALYVKGFPPRTTPGEVRAFFLTYGKVDKCVTVVDMVSGFSFRWVIMANAQDINRIIRSVQGLIVEPKDGDGNIPTFTLGICQAMGGTRHFVLDPRTNVDRAINGDPLLEFPDTQTVRRYSSPTLPKYQQPLEAEEEAASQPEPSVAVQEVPVTRTPDIVITKAPKKFVTMAETWARIAGTAPPVSKVINLHPEDRARLRQESRSTPDYAIHRRLEETEPMIDQMRVVFLVDLPNNLNLQDVSDAVKEGSLRSINFGIDADKGTRFAGLVFQYATEAEMFHQVLCKERADSKPGRFKFVVESIRGEAFPIDETIRAMGSPSYASRRLTIVKSKFFFMFGERQMRNLCEKLVPKENIQLIWLYNGGNATIVFSDVNSAISVKYALDKRSRGFSIPEGQSAVTWEGLMTTFSKDPSVAPLELKTAIISY